MTEEEKAKKVLADEQYKKEQLKLFKNRVVVQKNAFISGNTNVFSALDMKIFKLIISKVKPKSEQFDNKYIITTDELKALNINESQLSRDTQKSLKKLTSIFIKIDQGDKVREVGLLKNDFTYHKYSKMIEVSFNEDMEEYLLDIKDKYTKYELIDIVNFKLKHTIKLYEYMKSISLNTIKISVDKLKDKLDLLGKYKSFTEFKRTVLNPIIEEINTKTESLTLNYSLEKKGKKVEFIIFHIQRTKKRSLEISDYAHLVGKECLFENRYCTVKKIDLKMKKIVLLENVVLDEYIIEKDTEKDVIEELKLFFPAGIEIKNDVAKDLDEDIFTIKDFKDFKDAIIKQYMNKALTINVEGFQSNTIVKVNEKGLLLNSVSNTIISKDKAFIIWKDLFKNRDKVGKIEKIETYKNYIGIEVKIKTPIWGTDGFELLNYIIKDIIVEDDKYKLLLQDSYDENDEKLSKATLTLEQLAKFVQENRVDDK